MLDESFKIAGLIGNRIADAGAKAVGDLHVLVRSLVPKGGFGGYSNAVDSLQPPHECREVPQPLDRMDRKAGKRNCSDRPAVTPGRECEIRSSRTGATGPRPVRLASSHGASPSDVTWLGARRDATL